MKKKNQKLKINKRLIRFLPWAWMVLIFYASSRQRIEITESYWLSFLFFKILHILEYGFLFIFWFFALDSKPYRKKEAIVFSFLYGLFDEFHQTFVPTRGGSLRDVLINLFGILIFSAFVLKRIKKLAHKKFIFFG